jgi:hypothetical protein
MATRRPVFDPHAILAALERNYVDYVLIGGLAQVLRGADHITDGIDICPSFSAGNLDRLARAAAELHAQHAHHDGAVMSEQLLQSAPVVSFTTHAGPLQLIASPAGAPNGYVDLRRAATKEHIGQGLQPLVASAADLARMAAALNRDEDLARLKQLRRIMELDATRETTPSPPLQPAPRAVRQAATRRPRISR